MPISTVNQNGLNAPLTLTAPVFSGNVTATTITSPAATALTLQSAGTTAVTINTSQNVGVGTSSPSGKLHVEGGTENAIIGSSTRKLYFRADGSGVMFGTGASQAGNSIYFNEASNLLYFQTNSTERMRITSGGEVLVGTTSTTPGYGNTNTGSQIGGSAVSAFSRSAADYVISCNQNTSDGGSYYQIVFRQGNTTRGNIISTTGGTSYASVSDYRLKENIAPMIGALAKVQALKPCTYTWKEDGTDGQGFIAHELQAVIPDAVTGEKDAVETYTDENGNEQTRIKPQGIDTSFLVATLTAAIQELKAEFDAYKASHP